MTRFFRRASALVVFALMTTPLVAIAQDTSGQPGGEQSRAPRSDGRARMGMPPRPANPEMMTVAQVEQYFDQFVLFQAQARLALTDAQFLRFGAALRQLQDARRMQQRRRVQLLRQLGDLLAATEPDDAQISAKTKEVDDLLADGHRRVQDAYAAIDGVLSLRQRARFRVFEEAMERRKLDLLARARQQAGSAAPAR